MTRFQARQNIMDYLKKHNLHHRLINDSNKPTDIRDLSTIYLSFSAEAAPGRQVEASIWLYEDFMEVRGYYVQDAAKWCRDHANRIPELLSVINFINASVFPPNPLYTPRLHLTADEECEIAITTVIPYDFFELAPLESMEYITIYYPELLNELSVPLFLTLIGSITPDMAICNIRKTLLGEEDAQIPWRIND